MRKSKVAQELIIQCTPQAVKAKRVLITFDEKPLLIGENPATNQNCAYTSGQYTIKYKPGVPGMEKKPYVIHTDFLPGYRIRIGSYKSLEKVGKENIRIKWLLRNTTLTSGLFNIARHHIDMPITFSIDIVSIEKHLKENGETRKDFLWEVTEDDA